MIIDVHAHAWPEKVALKAREHLESLFKVRFVGTPTVSTLLRFMRKNRIDASVICAVATRPEQVSSINDWLFSVRQKKIRAFAALHPDYPLWKAELKRIKRFADGVKFQPEFQNFYIDEKRVFPVYEVLQEFKLPVLFHCGEELSGTMLVRSRPARMMRVKRAFPKLNVIAGHFGGFGLWDEVERYLLGQDIYLDTSFFFRQISRERIRAMILAHRPDRLLFGTDFPLVDQKQDIQYLQELDIPGRLKERIFWKNAAALLGQT